MDKELERLSKLIENLNIIYLQLLDEYVPIFRENNHHKIKHIIDLSTLVLNTEHHVLPVHKVQKFIDTTIKDVNELYEDNIL